MTKRLGRTSDEAAGIARYKLKSGRVLELDEQAVSDLVLTEALRRAGVDPANQPDRLPVMQEGQQVGTLPATFEPSAVSSRSLTYEPRPDDFRREGNVWIANKMLSPGDLAAMPDFRSA